MNKPFSAWAKKSFTTFAMLAASVLMTAGSAYAVGKVGDMAADWSGLKGLDNKTYGLKDFKGKVVLLMTVQYNCGGCRANAPEIGKIASGFQGNKFQAVGPDIAGGTTEQLHTFDVLLRGKDSTLSFPLLSGLSKPDDIKDSIKNNANFGTMWIPYNALRDVYFVIDHTGKIVFRLDGDRGGSVGTAKYATLSSAIASAIANVPTVSISSGSGSHGLCLQACKRNGGFLFDVGVGGKTLTGNVNLKILDCQGRTVRSLDWSPSENGFGNRQVAWNGLDSKGNPVAWGNYFISATTQGQSTSLLLSWLP